MHGQGLQAFLEISAVTIVDLYTLPFDCVIPSLSDFMLNVRLMKKDIYENSFLHHMPNLLPIEKGVKHPEIHRYWLARIFQIHPFPYHAV